MRTQPLLRLAGRSVGRPGLAAAFCLLVLAAPPQLHAAPVNSEPPDLEELAQAEIVSAAKKVQPLSEAMAAVYVLSREAIRQAHARSIPELLRRVPGLQVAQIDAYKWAVSIRGFNTRFSKYMLVMVDGRALYDSTLSGVYWENLALPIEEIERIEVVRGPGGALWGANAVNGIINIITRKTTDTLGGVTKVELGSQSAADAYAAYGTTLGHTGFARFYGAHQQQGDSPRSGGADNNDAWRRDSGGLRLAWWPAPEDQLVLQLEGHRGEFEQSGYRTTLTPPYLQAIDETTEGSGSHALARWVHSTGENNSWQAQLYYDNNRHDEALYALRNRVLDLDLQQHWQPLPAHELVWGLGYRHIRNTVEGLSFPGVEPELSWHNRNVFFADEFSWSEAFKLSLGAKWEDSQLTQAEWQPSLRALWKASSNTTFWAAYGKAYRTPNRIETRVEWLLAVVPPNFPPFNLPLPAALFLLGKPELRQESVLASEAGWRWLPSPRWSLDLSLFHYDYEHMVMYEAHPPRFDPELNLLRFDFESRNLGSAESDGAELALQWLTSAQSTLNLSYSYLDMDAHAPPAQASTARNLEGSAPRHQVQLWQHFQLADNWSGGLTLRWRSALHNATTSLPASRALDLDLGWRYSEQLSWELAVRNLGSADDPEFFGSNTAETAPLALLSLRYTF